MSSGCNLSSALLGGMESNFTTMALYGLVAATTFAVATKTKTRLELSRAKHRSLTGHVRLSRRIASLIPYYELGWDRAFACDGAPREIAERREAAFRRLADDYRAHFPKTIALKAEVKSGISDMQFTDAY